MAVTIAVSGRPKMKLFSCWAEARDSGTRLLFQGPISPVTDSPLDSCRISKGHYILYNLSECLWCEWMFVKSYTGNVVRHVLFLSWQPWVHTEPGRFLSVWLLWLGEALCGRLDVTIHHGLSPCQGESSSLRVKPSSPKLSLWFVCVYVHALWCKSEDLEFT